MFVVLVVLVFVLIFKTNLQKCMTLHLIYFTYILFIFRISKYTYTFFFMSMLDIFLYVWDFILFYIACIFYNFFYFLFLMILFFTLIKIVYFCFHYNFRYLQVNFIFQRCLCSMLLQWVIVCYQLLWLWTVDITLLCIGLLQNLD